MNRHDKPWPHFVYRLFDAEGNLLYIGMTEGVEHRVYMHLTQYSSTFGPTLVRHYHHHTSVEYPDARTAHEAEKAAIAAECPPLNIHHNPKVWRKARNGKSVPVNGYPQILLDDPLFIRLDENGEPLPEQPPLPALPARTGSDWLDDIIAAMAEVSEARRASHAPHLYRTPAA